MPIFKFLSQAPPDVSESQSQTEASTSSTRNFSGLAYGGDVVSYFGGQTIIDLSTLSFLQNIAVLREHDVMDVVGITTSIDVSDGSIKISGKFADGVRGADEVFALMKSGLPWQMSVRIDSESVQQISHGVKETVNGREVTGPISIIRNGMLREVSFVIAGVDSNTMAIAASANATEQNEGNGMTEQNSNDAVDVDALKEEIDALKKELDAVKKERDELTKSARMSKIDASGIHLTDDQKILAMTMSDAQLGMMLSVASAKVGDTALATQKFSSVQTVNDGDEVAKILMSQIDTMNKSSGG